MALPVNRDDDDDDRSPSAVAFSAPASVCGADALTCGAAEADRGVAVAFAPAEADPEPPDDDAAALEAPESLGEEAETWVAPSDSEGPACASEENEKRFVLKDAAAFALNVPASLEASEVRGAASTTWLASVGGAKVFGAGR